MGLTWELYLGYTVLVLTNRLFLLGSSCLTTLARLVCSFPTMTSTTKRMWDKYKLGLKFLPVLCPWGAVLLMMLRLLVVIRLSTNETRSVSPFATTRSTFLALALALSTAAFAAFAVVLQAVDGHGGVSRPSRHLRPADVDHLLLKVLPSAESSGIEK